MYPKGFYLCTQIFNGVQQNQITNSTHQNQCDLFNFEHIMSPTNFKSQHLNLN